MIVLCFILETSRVFNTFLKNYVKYVLTIIFLVKNSTRRGITFNTDKQPLACYVHLKKIVVNHFQD